MSGNASMEIVPASEAPAEINRPLGFDLTFTEMRARVEALNEFYKGVMQQGTDYDVIPGTQKPCLLQPGAQLLDGIFGLAPTFEELPSSIKDWERGFFHVEMRCRLVSRHTGGVAAEGIGSCNSKEDRYRWRAAKRRCPQCGAEAIIKGKAEYGGGWVCFKKQDGCGAKFRDGDSAIDGQATGRVENEDPYSLVNTISKMAQKRAHLAATLNATGASRIFTQDVEDLPPFAEPPVVKAEPVAPTNGHAPQATPPPAETASQVAPSIPRRACGCPINEMHSCGRPNSIPDDDEPPSAHTDAALAADLDAAFTAQAPKVVDRYAGSKGAQQFKADCQNNLNLDLDQVQVLLGGTVAAYMRERGKTLGEVYAVLVNKALDNEPVPGRLEAKAAEVAATE